MAKSVNKVILIGNAGKDAELRYTPSGSAVANFSLATTRSRKDANDQWQDETEWHRIVCWERVAETAGEHVHKGSKVYIDGRIQSRQYTDKDGQQRTSYEIVANDIMLLDPRTPGAEGGGTPKRVVEEENFDDIPF